MWSVHMLCALHTVCTEGTEGAQGLAGAIPTGPGKASRDLGVHWTRQHLPADGGCGGQRLEAVDGHAQTGAFGGSGRDSEGWGCVVRLDGDVLKASELT